MVLIAEVATVVPEILSCSVRLATDVTPAAGKKEEVTYRLQSAVPLTVDRSVTLHAGKSTCSQKVEGPLSQVDCSQCISTSCVVRAAGRTITNYKLLTHEHASLAASL